MLRTLFLFCCFSPFLSFSQISMIELPEKQVPEPFERDDAVDTWNLSQPGYLRLSTQAQTFLYWTNYCRNNPKNFLDSVVDPILAAFPVLNKREASSLRVDLLKKGPLPMFFLNETLTKTAQLHSSDIARKKSPISHNSTNGTGFGSRMKQVGIQNCASENISLSSQSVLLSLVLLYLDIGLPDLGHRKALTDPNLREIGIGAALYGKDQYFLVQDIACSQN